MEWLQTNRKAASAHSHVWPCPRWPLPRASLSCQCVYISISQQPYWSYKLWFLDRLWHRVHLNVQMLMKWCPSCLALSPQSNRVEGLNSCSPCVVSQDCDLLATSGTCSHDFGSQSRDQWNLRRPNFTAQHVCNYNSNHAVSSKS